MKIVKGKDLKFIPASHEDPQNPGCLKKVLFRTGELAAGKIMMINWSKLPLNRSFSPHYHEDMYEVFIILSGKVIINVDGKEGTLEKGDAVIVPIKSVHKMSNISQQEVDYLAIGVSLEKGGKTINV